MYAALYELAGVTVPAGERTKPPCCGADGTPPMDDLAVDELVDRALRVRRTRGRQTGPT